MHRRAFIGTTATLVTLLIAGCARDDGGDGGGGGDENDGGDEGGGSGGGGGPYGMIGTGGTDMAARDADERGARSGSGRPAGPALGPDPGADADGA